MECVESSIEDPRRAPPLRLTAMALTVLTWNIHKGFDATNREFVLHELRNAIRSVHADVVLLQEVIGENSYHTRRVANWPTQPQFEFLADSVWSHYAYGRNAVYPRGHHGNVILSKYPIVRWDNQNISTNRVEHRGLLHCVIEIPRPARKLHLMCVHLGLTQRGRDKQIETICQRIDKLLDADEALVLGGDFNDWRDRASAVLLDRHGLHEAHERTHGRKARTFPTKFPLLSVDRIYFRGLDLDGCRVLRDGVFRELSDHAAVTAKFRLQTMAGTKG